MKARILKMQVDYKEHNEPFYVAHQEGWIREDVLKVEVTLNGTEFAFFAAQGENEDGNQRTWALFTEYGSIMGYTPYNDVNEHEEAFDPFVQETLIGLFSRYGFDIAEIKEHLARSKRKAIGLIGLQPQKEVNATDQSGQVH